MSSTAARNQSSRPGQLDQLLDDHNYDQDINDFLRDLPVNKHDETNNETAEAAKDPDAEVKVRKQRKPVLKLDQGRLLSDSGVNKLRKTAKARLKFKGKGHEFSDITRLLNMYQLWLDDMYPRAKFKDGLLMVEKLGHSKKLQIMRKAWIDTTRQNRRDQSLERIGEVETSRNSSGPPLSLAGNGDDALLSYRGNAQEICGAAIGCEDDGIPEQDELDIIMAEMADPAKLKSQSAQQQARPFQPEDGSDEDDMDALMAEEVTYKTLSTARNTLQPKRNGPFEDDEDTDGDELDAMLAEEKERTSHMANLGPDRSTVEKELMERP